jgi:hypothetical protein
LYDNVILPSVNEVIKPYIDEDGILICGLFERDELNNLLIYEGYER